MKTLIWVLNSVLIVLFVCYVIATWSWKWALAIPATILIIMWRKGVFTRLTRKPAT